MKSGPGTHGFRRADHVAIAQFIKTHSKHEVTILDAQLDDMEYDALEAKVREFRPDVVGVTAFTVQLVDVLKTVQTAKKGGAKYVVVGGPHVSDFPQECKNLPGVDAVVKGEGQKPMLDLCE